MEELRKEHAKVEKKGNFSQTINDVQKLIDMLEGAKESLASNPSAAPIALAKLKGPLKTSFDQLNDDLKVVHGALNSYSKVLNKKFKTQDLSVAENTAVSSQTYLVNRAIAMHLLREGQFSVAQTFVDEANASQPQSYFQNQDRSPTQNGTSHMQTSTSSLSSTSSFQRKIKSEDLQQKFSSMYHVLHELRQNRNLQPAIEWARKNSAVLESRGSNLEFELCRLQFIAYFTGSSNPVEGTLRAWAYARSEFGPFQQRYHAEIQQLTGAMAYRENLESSPYHRLFSNTGGAWEEVASSFTKEFCSLLGLSADSPLYVAATAGAIALPNLLKVKSVMKATRTEWTTHQEMPVEIPLPPAYHFHSIFVCPVSKEQATDANPPMMMPCGHVICKESLDRVSKGAKFKCPYCPSESHPREARKVFL